MDTVRLCNSDEAHKNAVNLSKICCFYSSRNQVCKRTFDD